jgi:putative hydrolase of the HAD superfamily
MAYTPTELVGDTAAASCRRTTRWVDQQLLRQLPELWYNTEFGPLVDCALFSCLEGVAKPARVLYERVCNGLDVDPTTCIYVDDGIDELRGAEAAGMLAVWLTTGSEMGHRPEWWGHRVSSPKEILAVVKAA